MYKSEPAVNLEEFDTAKYNDETRLDDDIDEEETTALISDNRKMSQEFKSSKTNSKTSHNSQSPKRNNKVEELSTIEWFTKLFTTFDRSYMWVMTVSYFIQGFKVFIDLSVMDLFK